MSVPNNAQVNRIASDLNKLARGERATDWRGNSYAGVVGYLTGEGRLYTLVHHVTPIAQIRVRDGKVSVLMFNARYISTTTRGFQSRIYRALTKVHAIRPNDLTLIADELARPTDERQVLGVSELTGTGELTRDILHV